MDLHQDVARVGRPWTEVFEDRYGAGSHARLLALLRQPCITFAEIATRFGVTRERVRQWHLQLLPDEPRGHSRQRLCWLQRQKRQLFADTVFGAFYRHARPYFSPTKVRLIRSGTGYRKRTLRLDDQIIALKAGHVSSPARPNRSASYALTSTAQADFVYYRLTPHDFLFVPASAIPRRGTTFVDTPTSKYQRFKNTFAALGLVATASRIA